MTDRLSDPRLPQARAELEDVPPGARERVWRRVQAERVRRGALLQQLWRPFLASVAVGAALVFIFVPHTPRPGATVVLVAGDVRGVAPGPVANGVTLETGSGAVAVKRSDATFVVAGRIRLAAAQLEPLDGVLTVKGRAVVATPASRLEPGAAGALFAVRVAAERLESVDVYEGEVVVRGLLGVEALLAGERWPKDRAAAPAGPGVALLRGSAPAEEGSVPLRIEGSGDVELDGRALGAAPMSLLVAPGAHELAGRPVRVPEGPGGATVELVDRYAQARERLVAGQVDAAAKLFERAAVADSARAQSALYELGRLKQSRQQDPAGALAVFAESQRRWPEGVLAQEVALSALEAHLALDHREAARAQAEAFLERWPQSERAAEVRALREKLGP